MCHRVKCEISGLSSGAVFEIDAERLVLQVEVDAVAKLITETGRNGCREVSL